MLADIIKQKNITMYRLSRMSGVPYSTISDICSGKTHIGKSSAETVYRLSKALAVSMEDLVAPYLEHRSSFDLYKSSICHRLKEQGDINFIIETLESDEIRAYYKRQWYPECLYLLAMLDYISRINGVDLCEDYNDLRQCRLEKTIYPSSLRLAAAAAGNRNLLKKAEKESIPEFIRFNIVENEVKDVV